MSSGASRLRAKKQGRKMKCSGKCPFYVTKAEGTSSSPGPEPGTQWVWFDWPFALKENAGVVVTFLKIREFLFSLTLRSSNSVARASWRGRGRLLDCVQLYSCSAPHPAVLHLPSSFVPTPCSGFGPGLAFVETGRLESSGEGGGLRL